MRIASFIVSILFMAVALSTASSKNKPVKSSTPLSADDIAIYRTVLEQYISREGTKLNVSSTTFPLDPSEATRLAAPECLKGIQLENLSSLSHSFHDLPEDVLPGKGITLVDAEKQGKIVRSNDPSTTIRKGKSVETAVKDAFATGLFSMSEIAFDKEHHFAVVSYAFWCGSLCGNGSTVVFEKINGEWRDSKRNCGGWVS